MYKVYCPICAKEHEIILNKNEETINTNIPCNCDHILKIQYDSVLARLKVDVHVYTNGLRKSE